MKMITKRFQKHKGDNRCALEDLINVELKRRFYCLVTVDSAYIKSAPNHVYAKCETPSGLRQAIFWGEQITFSVTLPAKYWK